MYLKTPKKCQTQKNMNMKKTVFFVMCAIFAAVMVFFAKDIIKIEDGGKNFQWCIALIAVTLAAIFAAIDNKLVASVVLVLELVVGSLLGIVSLAVLFFGTVSITWVVGSNPEIKEMIKKLWAPEK